MNSKLLILAYMGTGKTELAKHYNNVIDLDFQDYKYIYDEFIRHLPLEKRKGSVSLRTENPEYPNNFIEVLTEELNKGKIVVSPLVLPKVSFLDPSITYSVGRYQTACGSADILSHIMETYFSKNEGLYMLDTIMEGLMKTVIRYSKIATMNLQIMKQEQI